MKTKFLTFLFISSFALGACSSGSRSPDAPPPLDAKLNSGKEIASLSGIELHEGFIDVLSQINPNIQGQLKGPGGKKRLIDSLLEQEVFYKESMKRGLDKSPEVVEKAALYQRAIISQAVVDSEVKKRSKEYYDQNKEKEFSRVQISQIFIRPKPPSLSGLKPGEKMPKIDPAAQDAEAKQRADEAKQKLDSGMAWEEVVMQYSDDPITKNKGGDLGLISAQDRRVARLGWDEVISKAFSMKVGEISSLIKAKDGYHIIKVTSPVSIAPFEEVQSSIEFKLRGKVKSDLLVSLTGGKMIEYKDPELNKPTSPVPDGFKQGSMPQLQPSNGSSAKIKQESSPEQKSPVKAEVSSSTPAPHQ